MSSNENWRRFLDTGASVGQVTLTKVNEIAKGLMAPERETREQALKDLDDLRRAGRALGEQFADLALGQLGKPWRHGGSVDEVLDWIGALFGDTARHPEPEPTETPSSVAPPSEPPSASVRPSVPEAPYPPTPTKTEGKAKNKAKDQSGPVAGKRENKKKKKKKNKEKGSSPADPGRVLVSTPTADSSERR